MTRPGLPAALAAVLLSGALWSAPAGATLPQKLISLGPNFHCYEWNKYGFPPAQGSGGDIIFILGNFISGVADGAAAATNVDILEGWNVPDVYAWISKYCAANPKDTFRPEVAVAFLRMLVADHKRRVAEAYPDVSHYRPSASTTTTAPPGGMSCNPKDGHFHDRPDC